MDNAATNTESVVQPNTKQIALLTLGWYASSSAVIFTNKWVMSTGFHFPVTLCFLNNALLTTIIRLMATLGQFKLNPVAKYELFRIILPVAICTVGDIVGGNGALMFLSVSFHTIIRSTAPVFILMIGKDPCNFCSE
jgi:solute carrier family 35 protein C2